MAGLHADTRISLPLRPALARHQKQNMREHLEAVQAIVAGLATGDFTAIETAASRMGYSRETATQCEHMGADAPGFAERAIAFHKSADEIAAAARRKDIQGVTANAQVYERAIRGSSDYDTGIRREMAAGKPARHVHEALMVDDIQRAADALHPIFEASHRLDGVEAVYHWLQAACTQQRMLSALRRPAEVQP